MGKAEKQKDGQRGKKRRARKVREMGREKVRITVKDGGNNQG